MCYQKIIGLFIFMMFGLSNAQNISGQVTDQDGFPLMGATLFNKKFNKGVITNQDGFFTIKLPASSTRLVVSYVGFNSKTLALEIDSDLDLGQIILVSDRLNEIVVTGTLRQVSKLDSPVPIELYTSEFFRANPTPSIFEAIESINGVRPQLNCNVCNTGDIHINGQEGANTMVLIDGLPLVSGLSTVYGLTGIPQSLIEQVEVIKGPASTLYGSEAIGGVINLITKRPDDVSSLSLESFVSSWRELNIDLGTKYRLGNIKGLLGVNYFNYSNPIDDNADGFTDLTLQHRISIFNKIHSGRHDLAIRYFYEDRWGGQMQWEPKFRGGDEVYGESIFTSRFEIFGKYDISDQIVLQYSLNDHHQNSVYGSTQYNAVQTIGFMQGVFSKTIANHLMTFGAAYRWTQYNDNTPATKAINTTRLPGLFVQDEWKINESHTFLSGLRYDRNSIYGDIWTPRMSYKWNNNDKTTALRLSFGTGYRVVNVFTEDHAALTGARDVVFNEDILPEKSWNLNINWTHKIYSSQGFLLDFDSSMFKTVFSNRILPDYETNPNQIIYENLKGSSTSQGVTLNLNSTFANGFRVGVGATYIDSYVSENGIRTRPLLTEQFSGNYKLSYSFNPRFKTDVTGVLIGPMKLPLLGVLDPRPSESPMIHIINLQMTHQFSDFEIYAGVKNLLDFTPDPNSIARAFDPFDEAVEFDGNGQVIPTDLNPNALSFDPSYVFYSNQGLRTFIGFRYSID